MTPSRDLLINRSGSQPFPMSGEAPALPTARPGAESKKSPSDSAGTTASASGGQLRCWIDLFDHPSFQGERRRFFGPVRLDAATLGLQHAYGGLSLRVGEQADVRITLADGEARTLHGGDAIDSLDARRIVSMEVRK